jgi:dihydroxyacetone kinase-like protein
MRMTTLDAAVRRALIEAAAAAVIAKADELTALDQAIGDGDHGLNMKRGFEAVLADLDAIAAKPLPEGLKQIGTTMVMKVGGASGPLYGTLFLQLGKSLAELAPDTVPDRAMLAAALAAAIEAVKARGKSEVGQKTLLDVLAPVQAALAAGETPADLAVGARDAAASTVPMKAIRGRASFLGERSVGHMDPGARSSEILITTIAGFAAANGAPA